MLVLTIKRYKKSSPENAEKLKSVYETLNEKNQSAVKKQASKTRNTALAIAITMCSLLVVFGILTFVLVAEWYAGLAILAVGGYFGYLIYTSASWIKVPDYELIRLVDTNWIKNMLYEQEVSEEETANSADTTTVE